MAEREETKHDGGTGATRRRAVKWLEMASEGGKQRLSVSPESGQVLASQGSNQLQLVSIFGRAREGKGS